jgi:hypothetical protein
MTPRKSYFLLIYRNLWNANAFVAEAPSLTEALNHAANAGLNAPNSFRLGQELDGDLIALLRADQVERILSAAEAKELLAMFKVRKSMLSRARPHRTYLPAAE